MPGAGSTSRGLEIRGLGFCRSSQHLDQPLEVDPARSSAAMEHLAKRSLCARVVIGEQAPGEVRVARREDRKVRVRQLAFTNSCPRDVPSGSIALGLFPMHPCSRPRATTSLQPLTTRKTSCTNNPTRKEQGGRGLQSRGCSDICNIACLLSHSPLIDSPPVPPPAEGGAHALYLVLCSSIGGTGQCSYTRVCRYQIPSWVCKSTSLEARSMVIVCTSLS